MPILLYLFIRVMVLNCTDGAVRYISLVKILIYWAGSIVPNIKLQESKLFLLPRSFMF